jgi:lipoyl(octanoyl) transferase
MQLTSRLDPPRSGEENMALDQELLERAERDGCGLLRLYRWSEPTLSLGHFQSLEDRAQHAPSQQLPVVRRRSGGGAIVHDREWTYAVALPLGKSRVGASTELYDTMHDALVKLLRHCGWPAAKWTQACEAAPSLPASSTAQPFLCFQRRHCGDIVCQGHKVVGSAQRRLGRSVLQHGSILLDTSPAAPELPGLQTLDTQNFSGSGATIAPTGNLGGLTLTSDLAAAARAADRPPDDFPDMSASVWMDLGGPLLSWLEKHVAETYFPNP